MRYTATDRPKGATTKAGLDQLHHRGEDTSPLSLLFRERELNSFPNYLSLLPGRQNQKVKGVRNEPRKTKGRRASKKASQMRG
uniref:Uncharacterized protein n=1 Tax=Picea glauca TaxID=3330 RepID=A0A101M0D6_PICGL|nr:hypothetical protein ABT39_MTgene4583 [Picea glauca]QHR88166.1 hypothetical protein Q903MT_gene2179 [Picea sitchensis]